MRKEAILLLHKQEKYLANIVIKLSNISKHSKLMLTKLRYQVKIHTISNRPRDKKKILQILPFFKKKKRKRKQTKQSYAKARSNMWMLDDANTEKLSLDLLFLSSPKNTCKVLSRDMGGKHNWFLDCI
jgi:hypothetical protein